MGTQSPGCIQKTKYMLSEALMRLLEKQSFRKILVGDICREAGISRSAFYGHFADKYELLAHCMAELLGRRIKNTAGLPQEAQMILLLEGVRENRRMMHNAFMADLNAETLEILQRTVCGGVEERLQELQKKGAVLPGPIPMVAAFCTGGLANVILGWMREGCTTPVEEVARCQCRMLWDITSME